MTLLHKRDLTALAGAVMLTPLLTSFVLLGKHKSKLPVSPEAPEAEFVYDPNGEVPSLSNKDAVFEGVYANMTDKELIPILLQTAMDQWNAVRGSYLRLVLVASETSISRSESDQVNMIVSEKNANASTAAFATPQQNPDNPDELYDCDISISLNSVSAASFLETVTHELGHCVGLGHPHNNYGAIMSYSRGGSSYRLGADDNAGAIFLYPDPTYGDENPKELIGCGNIGEGRRSSVFFTVVILMLPLAAMAYRFRRFLRG